MKLKIGEPTLRLEDERLLRGEGCFTDDIDPGEGLRVAFLRAPFAHARLKALDLDRARALAVHLLPRRPISTPIKLVILPVAGPAE